MANDKYKFIGKRLRSIRYDKGISIEKMHQITNIPLKYLKALENGYSDDLPGDYYTNKMVKQYTKILNISVPTPGDSIIKNFSKDQYRSNDEEFPTRHFKTQKIKFGHPILLGIIIILMVWVTVGLMTSLSANNSKLFDIPKQLKIVNGIPSPKPVLKADTPVPLISPVPSITNEQNQDNITPNNQQTSDNTPTTNINTATPAG